MADTLRVARQTAAPPQPVRARRWRLGGLGNYLFVAPAVIFLLIFMVYPVVFNVILSFQDVQASNLITGDAPFVGLDNYIAVLNDPIFGTAALNSLGFTVGSLVFQVGLGLALALFYNQTFPGSVLMRGLYLIAWTIPIIVSGAVFRWLLDGRFGVINWALRDVLNLADAPIFWLSRPETAMYAVIFVNIWLGIAFNMILLLAGLKGISQDLYEAASIDGASAMQRFTRITLPLLRSALTAVLILGLIYTFRTFDLIWVLTRGGPFNATQVLPTLAFRFVFEQFLFGRGAAVLNLLFVVLFALSLLYLRVVQREQGTEA